MSNYLQRAIKPGLYKWAVIKTTEDKIVGIFDTPEQAEAHRDGLNALLNRNAVRICTIHLEVV